MITNFRNIKFFIFFSTHSTLIESLFCLFSEILERLFELDDDEAATLFVVEIATVVLLLLLLLLLLSSCRLDSRFLRLKSTAIIRQVIFSTRIPCGKEFFAFVYNRQIEAVLDSDSASSHSTSLLSSLDFFLESSGIGFFRRNL